MSEELLANALKAVEWSRNVTEFLEQSGHVSGVADANHRLAIWAKQLEKVEKGNPALCFVREMQVSGHYVAALIGLALYKGAAGSMRTAVESALYFTYFRNHPQELSTLVRCPTFFVSKGDIIDFHKVHTKDFQENQKRFDLCQKLDKWYSRISAIVHGQVPGEWVSHTALSEIKTNPTTLGEAVKMFADGEQLVHHLLLCTVGREQWDNISHGAKKALVKGLSADVKAALGLDTG